MIAEWYFFLLTTLDAHTIDLEDFKVSKNWSQSYDYNYNTTVVVG
jgi:hypothetical protein